METFDYDLYNYLDGMTEQEKEDAIDKKIDDQETRKQDDDM